MLNQKMPHALINPLADSCASKARLLIVEDDGAARDALCDALGAAGFDVQACADGASALTLLDEDDPFDLLVSEVDIQPVNGLRLLREVRAGYGDLPLVLMTAQGTVSQAVEAIQSGAADYLLKPFDVQALIDRIRALGARDNRSSGGVVAADPRTQKVLGLAERVADTEATVMISGESGTGKEVIARFIHEHSPRAQRPFVAINCAAIPETMLEAVLFGYEKGAFTGAQRATPGKFEQAQGGTLLLDEISEMELGLQAKLLRVLQEREVERLGGRQAIPLDLRILATTNRNLREEVAAGRFREDLFYRLNVFPLHLPPLRHRREDIVPLATALLVRHGAGSARRLKFRPDALQLLQAHYWQGNVRELENVVQRAYILADGPEIAAAHIHLEMDATPAVFAEGDSSAPKLEADLRTREQQMIIETLKATAGCRKSAAEDLGISPRTLRYKLARMRQAGISVPG